MIGWQEQLKEMLTAAPRIAILGVGSELCGDDAAGMVLIERLRMQLAEDADCLLLAGSTAPENFTGMIRHFKPDLLLLVDAAHVGGEVGTMRCCDPAEIDGMGCSTHMLPLHVMLDYLSSETGCAVLVVGIQPGEMEFATSPCPEMLAAIDQLATTIVDIRTRRL